MPAGPVANAEIADALINLAKTTGKSCVDAVSRKERASCQEAADLLYRPSIPISTAIGESSFRGLTFTICKIRERTQRLETQMSTRVPKRNRV